MSFLRWDNFLATGDKTCGGFELPVLVIRWSVRCSAVVNDV